MTARLFRVIVPVPDVDRAAEFYALLLGIAGERVVPTRHYFDCGGTILALVDPSGHERECLHRLGLAPPGAGNFDGTKLSGAPSIHTKAHPFLEDDRMSRVGPVAIALAVAALTLVAVACAKGGTARPEAAPSSSLPPVEAPSSPAAPVISGSMLPRPGSVDELVAHADVIVLGTIGSVIAEKHIGPYGPDGSVLPAGEGGIPVTDYEVQIESVLKSDEAVAVAKTLVLRMFGHLSGQGAPITSSAFPLPRPGDHLLFALGRNPDGTYGSGPEGLLSVDGSVAAFADGTIFAGNLSGEQLLEKIQEATP